MLENKDKFYLYDRWFYILKETDTKITYSSIKDDILNGVILEIEKDTNKISIRSLDNARLQAKLYISDITKKDIKYHYKETTPHEITINDEVYVNLILEAFLETSYGRINKKSLIKISKKKNLNKICYDTPDIPLDKDLDMELFKIKSDMLDYYLGLIDNINRYLPKIKECTEKSNEVSVENIDKRKLDIQIPNEIYIYDRIYKLNKKENNSIYYTNEQDGENSLELKLDPNYSTLTGINIEMLTARNIKYTFDADYDKYNQIRVKFTNDRKAKIRMSYNDTIDAFFEYNALYNQNGELDDVDLKIFKSNNVMNLKHHPYFTNTYVDEYGNEYNIGNQDFAKLLGISRLSPNILKNIENELTKKKV